MIDLRALCTSWWLQQQLFFAERKWDEDLPSTHPSDERDEFSYMNFVDFYGKWLGKYTSPMDPMGYRKPLKTCHGVGFLFVEKWISGVGKRFLFWRKFRHLFLLLKSWICFVKNVQSMVFQRWNSSLWGTYRSVFRKVSCRNAFQMPKSLAILKNSFNQTSKNMNVRNYKTSLELPRLYQRFPNCRFFSTTNNWVEASAHH